MLVADVHDLALHAKLNITGFMKILKVMFFWYIYCSFLKFLFSLSSKKHDVRSNSFTTAIMSLSPCLLYRNKPAYP